MAMFGTSRPQIRPFMSPAELEATMGADGAYTTQQMPPGFDPRGAGMAGLFNARGRAPSAMTASVPRMSADAAFSPNPALQMPVEPQSPAAFRGGGMFGRGRPTAPQAQSAGEWKGPDQASLDRTRQANRYSPADLRRISYGEMPEGRQGGGGGFKRFLQGAGKVAYAAAMGLTYGPQAPFIARRWQEQAEDREYENELRALKMAALRREGTRPQFEKVEGVGLVRINPDDTTAVEIAAGGDDYTLTPGAARFDRSGRLIASVPGAPEYRSVGAGETLFEIPRSGPVGGPSPAPEADPAPNFANVAELLQAQFPSGRITSTSRTPDRNRAVGGAPNSYHLRGNAFDFVPPPGMTTAQAAEQLRGSGMQFAELIDEGDHVHVAMGGKPGGAVQAPGPRVVATGAPKPADNSYRLLTPQEVASQGLPRDGRYQVNSKTGQVTLVTGTAPKSTTPTEGERKASGLFQRLNASALEINELTKGEPDAAYPDWMADRLDGLGMENIANNTRSSGRQQVEAAQLDFLDAGLTLTTGAAYTREQLLNLTKSYFPQIGDSPETIAAKKQRRNRLVQTARTIAGRAAPSASGPAVDFSRTNLPPGAARTPLGSQATGGSRSDGWGKARVVGGAR